MTILYAYRLTHSLLKAIAMNQLTCDKICDLFSLQHEIVGTTRLRGRGHVVDHVFYDIGDYEHPMRILASKSAREIYGYLKSFRYLKNISPKKYHTIDCLGNTTDKMYVVLARLNKHSYDWAIAGSFDGYVEAYKLTKKMKEAGHRVALYCGTDLAFNPR